MRSLINAFAMTIFFTSSAIADITIGNFSVSTEKDPFGEADKYIAATVQKGSSFAVRCLSGELSLAFFVSSKAREGQDAEVKLRIDEGKVDSFEGGVVGTSLLGAVIQAGDERFIAKLASGRRLAMKYEINGVGSTYTYDLRGIDRVVVGAQKACRVSTSQ